MCVYMYNFRYLTIEEKIIDFRIEDPKGSIFWLTKMHQDSIDFSDTCAYLSLDQFSEASEAPSDLHPLQTSV